MMDNEATSIAQLKSTEEVRELRLMLLYYQRRNAAQENPDLLVSHEELEQQLAEKAQTMQMHWPNLSKPEPQVHTDRKNTG